MAKMNDPKQYYVYLPDGRTVQVWATSMTYTDTTPVTCSFFADYEGSINSEGDLVAIFENPNGVQLANSMKPPIKIEE